MRLKSLFTPLIALLLLCSICHATPFASGTVSVPIGNLVRFDFKGTADASTWADATFYWEIEQITSGPNTGAWKYTYKFTESTNGSALSHLMVEASDNFTSEQIISTRQYSSDADTTGSDASGIVQVGEDGSAPQDDNPDPGLFGIKWDPGADDYFKVDLITNRVPIWGDLFLKDGNVSAKNSGYEADDPEGTVAAGTYDDYDWIAVPDTVTTPVVPEPNSLAIFAGLAGLFAFCRMRKRRKS